MKKKIIGLALVASLMFTGVVSAASLWGTYKGNDVIRITSNGAPIKATDVPAISYNGRTMIPVNMLIQLGIPYTWDQANKTVDVNVTANNSSSSATTNSIKNAVKYADFFHNLESLGEHLTSVSSYYYTASSYITSNNPKALTVLSEMNGYFNTFISDYNKLNEESKYYSDSNISYILQNYYDSIEYYKTMDTYLNKYYSDKNMNDFNTYNNNNSLGINAAVKGAGMANQKYAQYINAALNAK